VNVGIKPKSNVDVRHLLKGFRVNRELTVRDVALRMQTSAKRVEAIESGGDVFLSEI